MATFLGSFYHCLGMLGKCLLIFIIFLMCLKLWGKHVFLFFRGHAGIVFDVCGKCFDFLENGWKQVGEFRMFSNMFPNVPNMFPK